MAACTLHREQTLSIKHEKIGWLFSIFFLGIPLFIVGITFLTSMDNYGGKH